MLLKAIDFANDREVCSLTHLKRTKTEVEVKVEEEVCCEDLSGWLPLTVSG